MNASAQHDATAGAGPRLQRARGRAEVGFAAAGGITRLAVLRQSGSMKLRLPRVHDGEPPVAVAINTAGGLTGGDDVALAARWTAGARAAVTTQAAERIYRALPDAAPARVANRLEVGTGARAAWLPQETILFDGARLARTLEADVAADGRLLLCEAVVFGRTAMGETVRRLAFRDRWRIRRAGLPVYADDTAIAGDAAGILGGPATGGGAVAAASVVLVAQDAPAALETARSLLAAPGVEAGASARPGLLTVRMLAHDGRALRTVLEPLLAALHGAALPRVWQC